MEKYTRFLQKLHDRVLTQEFDRVMTVLADEGRGKSTLMVETIYHYESEIKGRDLDIEDVLDRIVWSEPDELRQKMVDLPNNSCIAVMDAARLLNKKEAMKDEQKEIEKDLYDSRTFSHFVMLGFQNPQSVPGDLASRRSKNLVYLPARGRLQGFSRSTMSEWDWEDTDDLPDPDLVDSFPPLDGTELWEQFKEIDLARKEERISPDSEEEDSPPKATVVAEYILNEKDRDFEWYVSRDGRSGELYLDPDMMSLEYDLTQREAEQTRKLLRRQEEVEVEANRVLLDGEVRKEVVIEDEEEESEEGEEMTLQDIAEEVFENLGDFIGEDGRTGDYMLDPDRIAFEYDLGDAKARQVRKAVEDYDDVTIDDDMVARAGEVVASQSREV